MNLLIGLVLTVAGLLLTFHSAIPEVLAFAQSATLVSGMFLLVNSFMK